MRKSIILLIVAVMVVLACAPLTLASVGANADIDFSNPDLSGYGQEGSDFSVVDGVLKFTENGKYNALYFGEYADNIVYQFDYRNDVPASNANEYWGGCSIRCGASGRYDIGLTRGVNHQSRVRIWRAGAEVAYNISDTVGRGVPDLAPEVWSTVKVALSGGNIKIYIDDMLVIDYTDATPFTEGGFGLRANSSNISYDNVKFYPLSELVVDPMKDYTQDFSTDSFLSENPWNGPPFFDPDNEAFEIASGELRSASATGYKAVYFGAGKTTGVMDFKMKFMSGSGVGGASLNSWSLNGGSRYDISIGTGDEAVQIFKGESVAGSSDEVTGKNNPTLIAGTWYRIKILQDNGTIKVYVDDVLTVEYMDASALNGGYFGFRSMDSIVAYDDLSFYDNASLTLNPSAFVTTTPVPNPDTGDSETSSVLFLFMTIAAGAVFLMTRRSNVRNGIH